MADSQDLEADRGAWRRPSGRNALGAAIVTTILALNVFRAVVLPVVHDEALTYNHFVPLSWRTIGWAFYSNNHTLHTMLVKASTAALGLSSLSLRLPALAGGLLYLLAATRLCRRACPATPGYAAGLLGLTVSPFLLDYMVAARGYGLALAFFMWALTLVWRRLELGAALPQRQRIRLLPLISVLAALSVASNLAFAFVNTALLLTVFGAGYRVTARSRPRSLAESALLLFVPGGVLYLLLVPGILRFDRRILFVGAGSWASSWRSLVDALFGGFGCAGLNPLIRNLLPGFVQLILLLSVGLAGGALLHRLLRAQRAVEPRDQPARAADTTLFVATASILVLTVVLHTAAHRAAGVLLPEERTGIFLVPLLFLVLLLAPRTLDRDRFRSVSSGFVTTVFGVFVLLFLCCGHVRYLGPWRYDANSHRVFLAVRTLARENPGAPIGIDWLFEPSLNFYRTLHHAVDLPPFVRRLPTIDDAVFALLPARDPHDRRILAAVPLRVVYADPLSGAVVAAKRHLHGSVADSRSARGDASPDSSGR